MTGRSCGIVTSCLYFIKCGNLPFKSETSIIYTEDLKVGQVLCLTLKSVTLSSNLELLKRVICLIQSLLQCLSGYLSLEMILNSSHFNFIIFNLKFVT